MFGGQIEQLDHVEEDCFHCVLCQGILFCLEVQITGNYGRLAFIKVIKGFAGGSKELERVLGICVHKRFC
jgi:hypothetical protein